MDEQECLSKMIAPGQPRETKWRKGVIQIIVTRACDRSCYGCTQGSNLRGKTTFMTPEQYEQAVLSLKGYYGVYGTFGGNPCTSQFFGEYCEILRKHVPYEQRGLWSNHPLGWGKEMRRTFNPHVSNLNVHQSKEAYDEFKRDWPECMPCGLNEDSRHSSPFVAMKDVLHKSCYRCEGLGKVVQISTPDPEGGTATFLHVSPAYPHIHNHLILPCALCSGTGKVYDESRAWELISNCDINRFWSAAIGVFRGQLRAWFCEIAASQSILHQDDPDYPDTGHLLEDAFFESKNIKWWQLGMNHFVTQVRKHCHDCGIPLRGYGELANAPDDKGVEQTSQTHADIYKPKRKDRRVELVMVEAQLGKRLEKITKYLQNAGK